jgi:hypothetical protein
LLGCVRHDTGPPPLKLNPLLVATASPPIPEAKAWAEKYDGARGPLIDLSQAVPGYPPHAEFLQRLGAAASSREAASYPPPQPSRSISCSLRET